MFEIGLNTAKITAEDYAYTDVATIDETVALTATKQYAFQALGTVKAIVSATEPADNEEGFVIIPYEKFIYTADSTNKLYFSAAYGPVQINIAEVPVAENEQ